MVGEYIYLCHFDIYPCQVKIYIYLDICLSIRSYCYTLRPCCPMISCGCIWKNKGLIVSQGYHLPADTRLHTSNTNTRIQTHNYKHPTQNKCKNTNTQPLLNAIHFIFYIFEMQNKYMKCNLNCSLKSRIQDATFPFGKCFNLN